ncbi:MAG TPA: GNAT family N-acetyltransferase [Gaiellaceae bacterium]|jgi:GNAT superfamily N-acetyltransferase
MFREYAASIGDEFWVRDFEDELGALPGYYTVLLAARDRAGALVGSAAIKHHPDGAAELKRLYVRPAARGTGLGRQLATAAIDRARELGYTRVRLDTLPRMEAARGIYASLGFKPCEPWVDHPIAGVVFLEMNL